jgi:regulator of protease activity HflC (stomatin/prohibitin superfamily)
MWKVAISAALVTLAALIATGQGRASLVIGLSIAALLLALRAAILVVPERKTAVIFNHLESYTGLRRSGLTFILPFWEHVGFYIDLGPRVARVTIPNIHTRDQVPVAISLMLFYNLDPWAIRSELQAELIVELETSAAGILHNQVEHLLHALVGQVNAVTMLQPGVRARLEDCLTQDLADRVSGLGLTISGRVMLGHIALPDLLQAEINRAQQMRIHAQARADVVNTLREALAIQPDGIWETIIELEAIEAMGRSGAPIVFPYSVSHNGEASGNSKSRGGDK